MSTIKIIFYSSNNIFIVEYLIILFLGLSTLILQQEYLIKLKPTIFYWFIALFIFGCYLFKKENVLAQIFTKVVQNKNSYFFSSIFHFSCCIFMLCLGAINLLAAILFSTNHWLLLKIFGTPMLLLFFLILQYKISISKKLK